MRKFIIGAGVLLVLQLGLAVSLHLGGRGQLNASGSTSLFDFAREEVQRIDLRSADGEQIVLTKNGSWQITNHHQAPADAVVVDQLLDKISGLKVTGPVAVTREALRRFKVADDDFEKHLVLEGKDGKLADLYLGTAPAFRQLHVRKAGSEEVVAVALSSFELEAKTEHWLDKAVLKQDVENLTKVELPELTLVKKDDAWVLQDGTGLPEASPEKLAEVVDQVAGFTVRDVLPPTVAEELFQQEPVLQLTLSNKEGQTTSLRLFKHGDDYAVQSSASTLGYIVHALLVDALNRQVDELLGKEPEESSSSADSELTLEPPQPSQPPFQ